MTNRERLMGMNIGEFLELHREHYNPEPEYDVDPFTILYCQMQCCCFCPVGGQKKCLHRLDKWLNEESKGRP